MFYVIVEFPPNIDAQALYNEVEYYHLNVTDIDIAVFMYGKVKIYDIGKIITICGKYGMIDINLFDAV